MNSQENEDILTVHDEDQAVEADTDAQYTPDPDSNVVVIEPPVVTIGRAKRRAALRNLPQEPSNQ